MYLFLVNQENTKKKHDSGKETVWKWFKEKKMAKCGLKISAVKKEVICNSLAKYVVPLIATSFMSTYWITGLYLYYFPTTEV